MEALYGSCARMIRDWKLLSKEEHGAKLEELARDLELRSVRPPRLEFRGFQNAGADVSALWCRWPGAGCNNR
jgi:hypothetical protein